MLHSRGKTARMFVFVTLLHSVLEIIALRTSKEKEINDVGRNGTVY